MGYVYIMNSSSVNLNGPFIEFVANGCDIDNDNETCIHHHTMFGRFQWLIHRVRDSLIVTQVTAIYMYI